MIEICAIYFIIIFVNFLQSTWIRPQIIFQTKIFEMTSLVNHHPVNIIISIELLCQIVSAKCFVTIAFHKIHLHYLSFAGVLYHAIVREHLALTVQHNLVFWNDNVYWMVIDKWCHLKNLGLEDFLWPYPSTLKKINRNIIIKYMAHI